MADKLTEAYDAWSKAHENPDGSPRDEFQAFQGGFTASAFSMRIRALAVAQSEKASNDVINKIGALPDIPE